MCKKCEIGLEDAFFQGKVKVFKIQKERYGEFDSDCWGGN